MTKPPGSARGSVSPMTLLLRVVAGVSSVALLGGVLWYALSDETKRDALARLGDATPLQITGLAVLSFLGIVFNGLVFWLLILPVKRLSLLSVVSTNAIATFLASVPFKLSVIVRVAVHRKRDGVEFAYIGPWFAAIAVSLAASLGPLAVASTLEREITPRWIGIAGGLVLVSWATIGLVARFAVGGRALRFVRAIGKRQPIGAIERALHTPFVTKLDRGLGMLCDPVTVALVLVTRIVDMLGIAARFMIAAAVLGVALDPGAALVFAVSYFTIGVLAPTGSVGSREAGTGVVVAMTAGDDATRDLLTLVPIVVGGAELVINAASAGLATLYIRPDRLLAGSDPADGPPDAAAPLDSTDADLPEPDQPDRR
ncbi:MAG: hypothetical protein AAF108_04570 [Planctomycetota bacterium]